MVWRSRKRPRGKHLQAIVSTLALLLMVSAPVRAVVVAGAPPDHDRQVEALQARVAALEAQNREILEVLKALRAAPPAPHGAGGAQGAAGGIAGAAATPATRQDVMPRQVLAGHDSSIGFYGFIRFDAIFDDSRSDAIQTPTFIRSEAPGTSNQDAFNFHPRLTRFGFNYQGPRLGGDRGAKLGGKIEVDFQNGGRESRQVMRMRHAFMTLDWEQTRLLVGQTWDIISPLYPTVNNDTMMWNAGNLGDRRPQVRGRIARALASGDKLTFEAGIGLSGAIDRQDLDSNGVRDGDDGLLQNLQARLAYARGGSDQRWTIGLSGHFGREQTQVPIAGENRFDSSSLSLDFAGRWGRFGLKGEAWIGSNLDDFRGGIGQGVNVMTGREIDAAGGWLEAGLEVTQVHSIYLGFTTDDPSDADLPAGGRSKNEVWYLVQRFRLARSFLVGIDYLNWRTEFQGLPAGEDNRFNLYLVYNF